MRYKITEKKRCSFKNSALGVEPSE